MKFYEYVRSVHTNWLTTLIAFMAIGALTIYGEAATIGWAFQVHDHWRISGMIIALMVLGYLALNITWSIESATQSKEFITMPIVQGLSAYHWFRLQDERYEYDVGGRCADQPGVSPELVIAVMGIACVVILTQLLTLLIPIIMLDGALTLSLHAARSLADAIGLSIAVCMGTDCILTSVDVFSDDGIRSIIIWILGAIIGGLLWSLKKALSNFHPPWRRGRRIA